MKSPFPGMDPYIEACDLWGDFHHHLIEGIYAALARTVPARYLVRTEKRSYIVLQSVKEREHHSFVPDVGVLAPTKQQPTSGASSEVAVAEALSQGGPVVMRPFVTEVFRESFVEIYDTDPKRSLVTTIEVLSPSNKRARTKGWRLYRRKRQALLLSQVNFVEIDLLWGGKRMPMLDPWPNSPYTLLVARKGAIEPRCTVWPAFFQMPLDPIPVPLLRPDPDAALCLQPMIEAIYSSSRYHESIDYSQPLRPPLSSDEEQWTAQRLSHWKAPV